MKLECPMLTSTEPWEEFRPIVTDLFFIRYSNSRPSSRATADPNIPLTTAIFRVVAQSFGNIYETETCQRLRRYGKEITSGIYDEGKSNITPLIIWLGTCQTGGGQRLQPTAVKTRQKSGASANQKQPNGRKCIDRHLFQPIEIPQGQVDALEVYQL